MNCFVLWQWAPEIGFLLCEKAEISMGNKHTHSHIGHDKILQKLSSNTGFSTLNNIYNKYTFEFLKDLISIGI